MRGYSKDSVETHNEHYGKVRPAVNVKVYHFLSAGKIMDKFKCSEDTANRAGEFAFQSAREQFWEDVQSTADDVFGEGNVKVYSEGRSGGWCIVDGLSPVENWSLMELNRWHSFEVRVKASVKFLTSDEVIAENIEANRWAEDGSEVFNFLDRDGETVCLVDLKSEAAKAGFAPVVRK